MPLILQTLAVASLGAIIFLMVRALPRIEEAGEPPVHHVPDVFDRLLARLPVAKFDASLNSFLEKFLRKSKIVVMRVDNVLTKHITRVRKEGERSEREGLPLASKNENEPPAPSA